jgi:hypothetical protein
MKKRSFAMIAMSGILAASFAYVAPAMADDSAGQSMSQAPASTDSSTQSMDNQGNTATPPSDTDSNMGTSGSNSTTGTDQSTSPDTATGDDDY